jgi:hypothetical protein
MPKKIIGISNAKKTCHFHLAIRNKRRKITIEKPAREIAALVLTAVVGSMSHSFYFNY